MLKKILIGIGVFVAIIIALAAFGFYKFMPSEHTVLEFIEKHPEKSAIKLVRNDTVLAQQNVNKMMPLASTVKIILAIEYAAQSANGLINPNQKVALRALDQFYVPNTDGGAHTGWLNNISDHIENDSVTVREIAKGMIRYSSNANTEWLSETLGLENINNRLYSLGIKNHSQIYYIVSALFVGKELFPEQTGNALVSSLKSLSKEEYIQATDQIHEKLLSDKNYKNIIGDLGMNVQRVWSDNLPSSTVEEYARLMKKINSRSYFDSKTQQYLDEVMEFLLENLANREWLEHTGSKGGSTAFVLTKALYATDKKGNKTELVYFFNDLGTLENTRLQMSMNDFELNVLTDSEFRKTIRKKLSE